MSDLTEAIPVKKWFVRLEAPIVDEQEAREAWVHLVRAQGWSPVGEPQVVHHEDAGALVGRVVQYPGLTVSPDIRDAILVPR